MVLVAGLTSRREPASFSRRLIECALGGEFELVVTDILLRETHDVLVDPAFVGRVSEPEAAVLIGTLAEIAAVSVRDSELLFDRLTDDPDDDYLAHAANAQMHSWLRGTTQPISARSTGYASAGRGPLFD